MSMKTAKAVNKMTFWPCWSLCSWYKVLSHKQYFPSAPFPPLQPSLCLCGGWSQRRWPAWRALKRHVRVILNLKFRLWHQGKVLQGCHPCTCLGKHSQWSMSRLRQQSPGFLSAGEHRPFSWPPTPVPGPPVPLLQPPSIWRTASWLRSTWKSADTFLPSRTSSRASDTKKGSI